MYDSSAITTLTDRIGWAAPVPPSSFTVSSAAGHSDSGRYFNGFHKMATVENVKASIANPEADDTTVNAVLVQMKKEAVLKVLSLAFDTNDRASYSTDWRGRRVDLTGTNYTDTITHRPAVLDDAVGYQVAIDAIEMMIATPRSNATERAMRDNYASLKVELEGGYNENGKLISKGLYARFREAIAKAIDIYFPLTTATATIRGVSPW